MRLKSTVAKPYRRATAKNAAEFLKSVRAQMPDPVRAVQIDGGSEFMAVPGLDPGIEQACAEAKIPLYVLPPRSPKLNGAVERCNGAWRYEFYACSDLPLDIDKIAKRVDAFRRHYNRASQHPSVYVIELKRLCWLQTGPAGYLALRWARSVIDFAASVESSARAVTAKLKCPL